MNIESREEFSFSTEFALLGFLKSGPRHGYAIYQELDEASDLWLVWRMKQSQLYALLARLEERGFLTSFKGETETGRPPRKMYRLTQSGHQAFQTWLQTPVERGRQFRLDLLIKLYFARQEGSAVLEKLLHAQRDACHNWLHEARDHETSEEEPYRRLVHRYRAGQVRAMLEWLDACQDEFIPSSAIS